MLLKWFKKFLMGLKSIESSSFKEMVIILLQVFLVSIFMLGYLLGTNWLIKAIVRRIYS